MLSQYLQGEDDLFYFLYKIDYEIHLLKKKTSEGNSIVIELELFSVNRPLLNPGSPFISCELLRQVTCSLIVLSGQYSDFNVHMKHLGPY